MKIQTWAGGKDGQGRGRGAGIKFLPLLGFVATGVSVCKWINYSCLDFFKKESQFLKRTSRTPSKYLELSPWPEGCSSRTSPLTTIPFILCSSHHVPTPFLTLPLQGLCTVWFLHREAFPRDSRRGRPSPMPGSYFPPNLPPYQPGH